MIFNIIENWAIWVPLVTVVSLHLLKKSQSQAGYIYPKDMSSLLRKRVQVFSFQTQEQFDTCHIKGARRVDITEIDPDAFMLMIEKKYPVFCYCADGVQSYRYFTHIQPYQKAYWLSNGMISCQDKIEKFCIWSDNE